MRHAREGHADGRGPLRDIGELDAYQGPYMIEIQRRAAIYRYHRAGGVRLCVLAPDIIRRGEHHGGRGKLRGGRTGRHRRGGKHRVVAAGVTGPHGDLRSRCGGVHRDGLITLCRSVRAAYGNLVPGGPGHRAGGPVDLAPRHRGLETQGDTFALTGRLALIGGDGLPLAGCEDQEG